MKNPEVRIYIDHILESIDLIEGYVRSVSFEDFLKDTEKQDAVMRRLEIIGEASKKLLDEFKGTVPEIPWKSIAGMRDKLIHEYFGVDLSLVWGVVKKDLSTLKERMEGAQQEK